MAASRSHFKYKFPHGRRRPYAGHTDPYDCSLCKMERRIAITRLFDLLNATWGVLNVARKTDRRQP